MRAVTVWSRLRVAFFAGVVVVVDKIPARQQVARERRMTYIYARIQNGDFDGSVRPNTCINLLRARKLDFLGRPLCDVCAVVAAHTPRVADAPRISASD